MFFLLNTVTEPAPSLSFGDWPAWIALAIAIITPAATTYLSNKHQRQILKMQQDFERSKSCDRLISELTSLATVSPISFEGFSGDALEATRYMNKEALDLFIDFSNHLYATARMERKTSKYVYETICDVPFYLLPDPKDPKKRKQSTYKEICMLLINELKNAT